MPIVAQAAHSSGRCIAELEIGRIISLHRTTTSTGSVRGGGMANLAADFASWEGEYE